MNYGVDISVEGFFHWDGKANSQEDAKKRAIDACCEADFGQLENIDFSIYSVEKQKD